MPCCAVPMLCYAMIGYVSICIGELCCGYTILCSAVLCYALLCWALLRLAMPCLALLCHASLRQHRLRSLEVFQIIPNQAKSPQTSKPGKKHIKISPGFFLVRFKFRLDKNKIGSGSQASRNRLPVPGDYWITEHDKNDTHGNSRLNKNRSTHESGWTKISVCTNPARPK